MKKDVYQNHATPVKQVDQIKLYLDESISENGLAQLLHSSEFNVITANAEHHVGWSDYEHLKFAISDNRTLLTFNAQSFLDLHSAFMIEDVQHCGIIILNRTNLDSSLQGVVALINHAPEVSMRNHLELIFS